MSLYNELFPNGLSGYSLEDLKEVEMNLAVEIHSRGIERSIADESFDAITNSESVDEYMGTAKTYPTLKDLDDDELREMWDDYWSGMAESQTENEYMDKYNEETDFRVTEEDLVK